MKKIAWLLVFAVCFFYLPSESKMAQNKNIRSEKNPKLIALTFDDGPKEKFLNIALPIFEKNEIKATFFVNGCNFNKRTELLLAQMSQSGHSIQNHTYGHGNLRLMEKKRGEEWIISDIDKNAKMIERCTNKRPTFLRPPFWVIWPSLKKDLENHGYHVLTLDLDINSLDYELSPKEKMRHRVIENILCAIAQREKRDKFCHVVAMHEIEGTGKILTELINALKNRGYNFGTIEEVYPCVENNVQ